MKFVFLFDMRWEHSLIKIQRMRVISCWNVQLLSLENYHLGGAKSFNVNIAPDE